MQIRDKKAIVTGAVNNLSVAFCKELLRNGVSTVALVDNERPAGEQATGKLNSEFGRNRALFFECDIANSAEFCATFKKAISIMGGLDILINNADVISEADIAKAIDVNVTAVIRGTLLGIEQMQKDAGGKGGVIVNVSSVAGLRSLSQLPVYSAAKHAVVSFSRSFAQPYHYQRTGVRVIVLCPGFTDPSKSETASDDPQETEISRPQKVETVAHGLVYVIRCAQNGSIWINEGGKPVYEIQLPDTLPQKIDEFMAEES